MNINILRTMLELNLTRNEQVIMTNIIGRASTGGTLRISQSILADWCDISVRTLQRTLALLEQKRILIIERSKRDGSKQNDINTYTIAATIRAVMAPPSATVSRGSVMVTQVNDIYDDEKRDDDKLDISALSSKNLGEGRDRVLSDDEPQPEPVRLLVQLGVNPLVAWRFETIAVEQVQQWIDYIQQHPHIANPAGYIVRMLEQAQTPPEAPATAPQPAQRSATTHRVPAQANTRKTPYAGLTWQDLATDDDPSTIEAPAPAATSTTPDTWQPVLSQLELQIDRAAFGLLKHARVTQHGDNFQIAPSPMCGINILQRYERNLRRLALDITGCDINLVNQEASA